MNSISVAIATFDGARHLGERLAGLAGQTRPSAEPVVTDDGPADGTLDLLRAFAGIVPLPLRLHVDPRRLGRAADAMRRVGPCEAEASEGDRTPRRPVMPLDA